MAAQNPSLPQADVFCRPHTFASLLNIKVGWLKDLYNWVNMQPPVRFWKEEDF